MPMATRMKSPAIARPSHFNTRFINQLLESVKGLKIGRRAGNGNIIALRFLQTTS